MNGSRVEIKTGSEGPKHDPYHYQEITVKRADGTWVKIHAGLAEWLETSAGDRIVDEYRSLRLKFEELAGITPEMAERTCTRVYMRKLSLHNKHDTLWCNGFPGEELLYCRTCNTVIDTSFNISEVE